MGEKSHHGLVVFVQQKSPSLALWEEGLDCAPGNLQILEGDVLELVWAGLAGLTAVHVDRLIRLVWL